MRIKWNNSFAGPNVFFDEIVDNHRYIITPNWITKENYVIFLYPNIVTIFWADLITLFVSSLCESRRIIGWIWIDGINIELITICMPKDFPAEQLCIPWVNAAHYGILANVREVGY